MSRRRRVPFNADRDYAAPMALELVDELADAVELEPEAPARAVARAPYRAELPPVAPVPLATLELAWSLEEGFGFEAYLARSVEVAGGFRPMLERAGLTPG